MAEQSEFEDQNKFTLVFDDDNLEREYRESGGMASFSLLTGISVNTGIYLINEFNELRKSNRNATDLACFVQAVRLKFYPIVLTTLSTLIGIMPFIFEGESAGF